MRSKVYLDIKITILLIANNDETIAKLRVKILFVSNLKIGLNQRFPTLTLLITLNVIVDIGFLKLLKLHLNLLRPITG
jgi:hypothetical protein